MLTPMDDEEGTVVFTGVTYLGSATVNAPRSETEISRNMAVLNEQTQMVIPVTLSVPATSEGIVRYVCSCVPRAFCTIDFIVTKEKKIVYQYKAVNE